MINGGRQTKFQNFKKSNIFSNIDISNIQFKTAGGVFKLIQVVGPYPGGVIEF